MVKDSLPMRQNSSRAMLVLLFLVPLMLSGGLVATASEVTQSSVQDDPPVGLSPNQTWSYEYANHIYPWADADEEQLPLSNTHLTLPTICSV